MPENTDNTEAAKQAITQAANRLTLLLDRIIEAFDKEENLTNKWENP